MHLNESGWLVNDGGDEFKVTLDPLPPHVVDSQTGKKYRKFKIGPSSSMLKHSNGCVLGIVVHYSAALDGAKTIRGFKTNASATSSHGITCRDGSIIQCAPFGGCLTKDGLPVFDSSHPPYITHHAGLKSGEPVPVINGIKWSNPNDFAIGWDLALVGPLKKRGEEYFWWPPADQYKTLFKGEVFTDHKGKYWEAVADPQFRATVQIFKLIVERFKIKAVNIVGHSDLTSRKLDPGPSLNWDNMIKGIYESSIDNTHKIVSNPVEDEEEALPKEEALVDDVEIEKVVAKQIVTKYGDRSGDTSCWGALKRIFK